MKIAIVGSSGVGKTTLFRLLTGSEGMGRDYFSGMGIAEVPDERLDKLRGIVEHKKVVYPRFEIYDFDGFGKMWREERAGEILQMLLGFDLIVQVVGDFGFFSPGEDFESIDLRFFITDMEVVERKLSRIDKDIMAGKAEAEEKKILEKILKELREEKPISQIQLTDSERKKISGYGLLTARPRLILLNRDERKLFQSIEGDFLSTLRRRNIPFLEGSLRLEMEINSLNREERKEFEGAYGIKEPLKVRFFNGVWKALDLIRFYTTAKGEIRAWAVKRGTTAKGAAGEIHTDMERGFIRAEVVPVDTLLEVGSYTELREKGLIRLEGKDYVVRDGDVLYIRFSV
jgi:hypothetical protein